MEPEQQVYFRQLEELQQKAEIGKGIAVGMYEAGKDTVMGLYQLARHPIESLSGTVNAALHPIDTYKIIAKDIEDTFQREMINGDSHSRAKWVSYVGSTVVLAIVGPKGIDKVSKVAKAGSKVAALKTLEVSKTGIKKVLNTLKYQVFLNNSTQWLVVQGLFLLTCLMERIIKTLHLKYLRTRLLYKD